MTDLLAAHAEIRRYIDSIRNKAKREYAEAYYLHVIRNGQDPGAFEAKLAAISPADLSYMGAQSVRLKVAEIIRSS